MVILTPRARSLKYPFMRLRRGGFGSTEPAESTVDGKKCIITPEEDRAHPRGHALLYLIQMLLKPWLGPREPCVSRAVDAGMIRKMCMMLDAFDTKGTMLLYLYFFEVPLPESRTP